jgi:hypothetical protein
VQVKLKKKKKKKKLGLLHLYKTAQNKTQGGQYRTHFTKLKNTRKTQQALSEFSHASVLPCKTHRLDFRYCISAVNSWISISAQLHQHRPRDLHLTHCPPQFEENFPSLLTIQLALLLQSHALSMTFHFQQPPNSPLTHAHLTQSKTKTSLLDF